MRMRRLFGWFRRPGAVLSDNRGGPWGPGGNGGEGGGGDGGGPRNPWGPRRRKPEPRGGGGGGGKGGGDVTSLDEFLRRSRARFGGGIPGGSRPYIAYGIVIAFLLWIAFTSIHRIGPQERGVVTTFGWYSGTMQPGIGFSWPWPIGGVTKVDVAGIRDIQIPGRGENLILTGDQNVINLGYTVRWNIRSPEMYLFQLDNPDETVREVAESAMRAEVARVSLDDALGAGRGDIEQRVQRNIQDILDRYRSGVQIQSISISQSVPPAQVNAAFLQVSAANQQAQSAVNAARGYAQQVTARAQGEAAQFERIYAQYRLAPDVTRRRMYYETMERILQQVDTTIVEAPGVTPYLPLPQIQSRPLPATPAPAQGAAR
jgi:membrane protease subunit HflK